MAKFSSVLLVACATLGACSGVVNVPSDVRGLDAAAPADESGPVPTGTVRDDAATGVDAGRSAAASGRGREDSASASVDASGGSADAASTAAPAVVDVGAAVQDNGDCPKDAPRPVTRVRVFAADGQGDKLVGARIQGSNTGPTLDFVDLATVERAPPDGGHAELTIAEPKLYRWVKYYAGEDSPGALAELELYAGDVLLDGKGFGTASADGKAPYASALDGDRATAFAGSTAGGSYVGLDLGGTYVASAPTFTPPGGALAAPGSVTLASSTPGAKIRYTTDGTSPSRSSGSEYGAPVPVASGATTLKAIAYADCYFDSEIAESTYRVGQTAAPATSGLKSYHIGNSLTDTINPWLEPIADSTGVDHQFSRWTMPGTPLGWIWDHRGPNDDGIGTPGEAKVFDSWVKTFAPIDHISVQPYSDPTLSTQAGAAINMFKAARAASPDVQFWIYDQWPSPVTKQWQEDSFANWAPDGQPKPPAPKTWEEAVTGQVRYHEAFRKYVDDAVEGKPVLVVPAGLALLELKKEIDRGAVPGINDFFGWAFGDEIHLHAPAQYLVSLVFYACMYKQTPEGRVKFVEPSLTPEQGRLFQQIAWRVVSGYAWSGL
jgi:hypothetical protein